VNEIEQTGLATMRDCWITGGTSFELAPATWKEFVAGASPDERERRLLAIAAQALEIALRPAAPKTLKRRPPLPELALPMLPGRLRPLLRAALKHADDARGKSRVVALVASRGFVLHPMDWMPAASDQTSPDVYAPWIDWQAGVDGEKHTRREQLTAQNWDELYPAARRSALADMRRTAPAVARQLIETRGSTEPAEIRLALIALMHFGLGPDDVPFLKSLSTDRSGKVRELAGRLLARLGQHGQPGDGGPEDPISELAAFIAEGKSGFIRRRTTYTPAKLKSPAQERRRAELFETCNLVDLAARFGVTESDFIGAWQFGADNNRYPCSPHGRSVGQRCGGHAHGRHACRRGWQAGAFRPAFDAASGQSQATRPDQADPEGHAISWRAQSGRGRRSRLAGLGRPDQRQDAAGTAHRCRGQR